MKPQIKLDSIEKRQDFEYHSTRRVPHENYIRVTVQLNQGHLHTMPVHEFLVRFGSHITTSSRDYTQVQVAVWEHSNCYRSLVGLLSKEDQKLIAERE